MTTNYDASKYATGAFLKGSELPRGKQTKLTVEDVSEVSFPDQKPKLVLSFEGTDQQLPLNKSQTTAMIDLFGNQTAMWVGQTIALMPVPGQFQGKPIVTIMIIDAGVTTPTAKAAGIKTTDVGKPDEDMPF